MNERRNDHQRYLSDRSIAWLLEYFLASTTPQEGGAHLPGVIAATEITGVIAPDRDTLEITARAWRADVYERSKSGEPGDTSKLPYIRNGRPTAV